MELVEKHQTTFIRRSVVFDVWKLRIKLHKQANMVDVMAKILVIRRKITEKLLIYRSERVIVIWKSDVDRVFYWNRWKFWKWWKEGVRAKEIERNILNSEEEKWKQQKNTTEVEIHEEKAKKCVRKRKRDRERKKKRKKWSNLEYSQKDALSASCKWSDANLLKLHVIVFDETICMVCKRNEPWNAPKQMRTCT